jgi:hypothetical protein
MIKGLKYAVLAVALALGACGCSSQESKDLHGKYVKDSDGTIYRLELRAGEVFMLWPIEAEEIATLLIQKE